MNEQTLMIDSVIIRRMKPGDENALVEFYNGLSENSKRTFRPIGYTTTASVCEDIIKDNSSEIDQKFDLLALHETCIVGWGFLWNLQSGEPTFGLGVADNFHGKGMGSKLIDSVMKTARERGLKKVFLTVVQYNQVAWKMYEKRGFVKYGEFVGEDGLDYFRMVAEL
ncbi:GNAT family N-acetyltransferase [bacterium]|nr:GNAT family N-acetyltransferase [bacterium]